MQKINNLLHRNRDANGNGIPDSQERTMYNAPLNDRNMNGIPDNQERVPLGQKVKNALHLNRDANHNGIPDSQERDRNHNGIPDAQEKVPLGQKVKNVLHLSRDANHNGIPDSQERGYGYNSLADRNHNGIPDSQERGFSRMPAVPAPFLERRSALHRELLGRNGQWNLRGAQTRSYLPRDYYNMETQFNTQNESLLRTLAPVNLQRVEKEVVVHEHIHPVEKEEIQPVIYREREQLDIKQITQQLHETQIQPTFVQQRELAPEYREAVVERAAPIQENIVLPSVDRDATMRSQVVHAPIVNETIKKTVIEEIQPVLERDVIQSTLIKETKPIYEKVIEAPIVYRETTIVNDRGISGGSLEQLTAQGFNLGSYSGLSNDRNMNGIPDNLERGNFSNDRNMNGIPDNLERTSGFGTTGLSNDRNMNGIPDNLERRNPLDRNGDGKVDLKDLTGRPGYGQQGLAGNFSNDRNMNGIPDNLERSAVDRNMNGIPDNQERFGAKTLNPLDRNNDGKVDLKDLTANKQQTPFRAF